MNHDYRQQDLAVVHGELIFQGELEFFWHYTPSAELGDTQLFTSQRTKEPIGVMSSREDLNISEPKVKDDTSSKAAARNQTLLAWE